MRKAQQSARTKRAVIDAAVALFSERGYRATSLKAIGEQAGISHGVIPFHFGSKEGLLLAVVETCFEAFSTHVIGAASDRERDFGVGDLEAMMTAQRRFADERPQIGRLFQVLMFEAIGPSPELRPHFREFQGRLHARGCAWVREGQARGVLREDLDVEAAVATLESFLTGLRTRSLLIGDEGVSRQRIHEQMLSLLRRGVTRDEQGES